MNYRVLLQKKSYLGADFTPDSDLENSAKD